MSDSKTIATYILQRSLTSLRQLIQHNLQLGQLHQYISCLGTSLDCLPRIFSESVKWWFVGKGKVLSSSLLYLSSMFHSSLKCLSPMLDPSVVRSTFFCPPLSFQIIIFRKISRTIKHDIFKSFNNIKSWLNTSIEIIQ